MKQSLRLRRLRSSVRIHALNCFNSSEVADDENVDDCGPSVRGDRVSADAAGSRRWKLRSRHVPLDQRSRKSLAATNESVEQNEQDLGSRKRALLLAARCNLLAVSFAAHALPRGSRPVEDVPQ